MNEKHKYNKKYSKWFFALSEEYKKISLPVRSKTIFNKSNRINNCMNFWQWDLYEKNKLMDLQKVSRCMDNRFCPNCRRFNLASAIHNLSPFFKDLLSQGYYPYLLTLTIPNVEGLTLRDTIDKLYKAFRKFYYLFSRTDKKGCSFRLIDFEAALRVLEVTCNDIDGTYHPHLHIMVFSKNYDESLFHKYIKGEYSNKRHSYNYYSDLDMHIRTLWTMCFNDVTCTFKHYKEQQELYLADIKEMDEKGIYEVLKYTFKDTDIKTYRNFKDIFLALEGKRIRQGYGLLYNLKCEDEAEGEKLELELIQKEEPQQLLTREINKLITVYKDYRKVSRFKNYQELEKLD